MKRRFYTKEEDEFLRLHYAERGRKWCAAQLGRTRASVYHRAADHLGLSIDKEKSKALLSASMIALYASERRRLIFGMEQRTGLKAFRRPREKHDLRSHMKKAGYIVGDIEDNCICYDDGTRRSRLSEAHCRRIGIQVRPVG